VSPDDRDPHVTDDDRLLKRSLTPADPVADGLCLDAETLAAWADGAIPAPEAEEIERHLAACARCQAMLATFANAELAAAAAIMDPSVQADAAAAGRAPNVVAFKSSAFRSRLMSRWVPAALGALAASLVIYAAWPARPTSDAERAEETMASAAPTPQPPAAGLNAFRDAAAPMSKTAEAPADRKAASETSARSSRQTSAAPKPAPRLDAVEEVTLRTAPPGATGSAAAAAGVTLAAPPPPPAIAPAAIPAASPRPAELFMLGTAAKDAAASRVVVEFTSPQTSAPALGQSLINTRGAGGGAAAGGGGGGRGGGLVATPRPTARVNWRVLASGAVERSVNGGQTWTPVTIAPAATVVNGAAPSANVCWLIGRAGIVLLATDGVTFRRIHLPDVADLRSITALDEFQATVTTIDGRVFKTEDGGVTWKQ
jgi:hypothetical protein